ncbi:ammonia channel protein [Limnohabitans sp. 2KL-1]|uniref:ammonium transporter n=1 Tax=Limnohabitans sp. 2KL-1 TaxID=1100699 RepID=UPI000D3DB023|nr:ammonium transporter [Limnohabitans sp. 2KL-1]PUE50449.1 ammonia channel protein [Limnohabitans sp. 2KL-1]
MKKLLATLALGLSLGLGVFGTASVATAQTAPAAVTAPAAEAKPADAAAAPAAPAAAAPAAAEAAPVPVPNKADTGWMMLSTILVILMVIPGLALFYGGLVRSKNMLSVLMQVVVTFSMITVLWFIYGYSLAFTEGNAFIGGFDRLFMKGIWDNVAGTFANAATFSKGVYIPEISFAAFQATFAGITCALIVGAFAERIKFSAVLAFMVLWFTFSYLPVAHMVWFWMGPDAYASKEVVDEMTSKAGLLWQWGALDFAGGTVVHINAAVAGLVGAFMVGKRVGYGRESMAPHSLTLTMVGASLLWVGWFGFNAGSALEANGFAALAFINTLIATAGAVLAWCVGEALMRGKASMLGAASGAVAGLVAITPAAGNVGLGGALIIGFIGGFACLWGVNGLKKMLGADDSLDVFGVHGVGGIVGALLTGVFNSPALGGPSAVGDWVTVAMVTPDAYSIAAQVWTQAKAVLLTIVWSGVVSVVAFKIVDLTIGLRVTEEEEREGLDISSHGESAYHG